MNPTIPAAPFPRQPVPARAAPRVASGFTLVELLTVVAIVGILAALIIPVVAKVRQTALRTDCASNLRQLGQGLALYVADHKGVLPTSWTGSNETVWRKQLLRGGYLGKPDAVVPVAGVVAPGADPSTWNEFHFRIFSCKAHVGKYDAAVDGQATYAMNSAAAQAPTQGGTVSPLRRLSEHQQPARTMIIGDAARLGVDGNGTRFNPGLTPGTPYRPEAVHGAAANLLFLDGHVESRRAADIPVEASPVGSPAWVFWGPR